MVSGELLLEKQQNLVVAEPMDLVLVVAEPIVADDSERRPSSSETCDRGEIKSLRQIRVHDINVDRGADRHKQSPTIFSTKRFRGTPGFLWGQEGLGALKVLLAILGEPARATAGELEARKRRRRDRSTLLTARPPRAG